MDLTLKGQNKLAKKRIDILIFEKGLAESRAKAQAFLLSGQVYVGGKMIDKAGTLVDEGSDIEVKKSFPYVSRGALKIQKAYEEFGLDFKDKVICDIGSSTGGFTDFVLSHGAKRVYAVDVGYGQLAQKLREDTRVTVMERTNFRSVDALPEKIDFFVCDVSFISLKKIIPKIQEIICHSRGGGNLDSRVKPEDDNSGRTQAVLLIKPQFEVGKKVADKCKGVVKDDKIQNEVVEDIEKFAKNTGFKVGGVTESPITGAKGNKEFLLWLA